MRRVVLGLGISLDGYIARLDGSVDFLFMPKDYSMGPFFKTIDTAIMGRKTYDVALRMSGGAYSNPGITSYVFSHTRAPGKRDGIIFVNESPKSFCRLSSQEQREKCLAHGRRRTGACVFGGRCDRRTLPRCRPHTAWRRFAAVSPWFSATQVPPARKQILPAGSDHLEIRARTVQTRFARKLRAV